MKNIIVLFLVTQIIANSFLPMYSANQLYAEGNIIREECEEVGSNEFFHITDERGNIVLTKKEINRDCILTKEVQGSCIKWEEVNEEFIIEASDYNAYRSQNHEGAMGSLLAMIGAYDQLEHLWSGWKGYCEKGTKTNFDWASDPMFWAGLAASAIMDGSSAGNTSKATEAGLAAGRPGSTAFQTAYDASMAQTKGFLSETALGQTVQQAQSTVGSWANGSVLTGWVGQTAGKCLMTAGVDLTKGVLSAAISGDEDDDKCDKVDEFCGSTEEQTEESDIMTIDRVEYNDLIAQHPEVVDYIIILNEEEGVMSIRFRNVNEMAGVGEMNQADLKEVEEKVKQMQMLITAAMTAGKLAMCLGTNGVAGSEVDQTSSSGGEGLFSAKSGLGMGISMIPAEWMGPYGILFKAAMQVLVNFMYSFQDINSCTNEDDAKEQGTRHEKTYESLPHDLCYFVYEECVDNCESDFLGLADPLIGYNYCCYDQILTKVLVVQLKAQLGRDWAHCTGITLRDMNFVSFRQCTASEMENGIDGGLEGQEGAGDGTYDPAQTFQYKNKCIDLTEFKEYLKAQIGEDIDLSDFDNLFSDVRTQGASIQ